MNLHYINDSVLEGLSANKTARINMAKAFAEVHAINNLYLYFIQNKPKYISGNNLCLKYNNIVEVPVVVNGYIDENEVNLSTFRKLLNSLSKIIVVFKYLKLFLDIKQGEYIYIRGQKCLISLYLVNLIKNNTYGIELHNFNFQENPLINYIYKKVMEKAKFLVTISVFTKNTWVKNGINKDLIYVLPSGVDLKMFDHIYSDKNKLRKELDLPLNMKIITYAGSLGKNRGIEAIIYCATKLSDYLFLIIGGTEEQIKTSKQYATTRFGGPTDNLIFIRQLPSSNIPIYLKASDILLAPYSKKIKTVEHMSPIKLFEYMASKVPIIVPDLPRIRDILNNDEAYFYEADNEEDMCNKIRENLSQKELKQTLAENSYKKVQGYSWIKRANFIVGKFYL